MNKLNFITLLVIGVVAFGYGITHSGSSEFSPLLAATPARLTTCLLLGGGFAAAVGASGLTSRP